MNNPLKEGYQPKPGKPKPDKVPKLTSGVVNPKPQQTPCSILRQFLEKHGADEKEWDAIDAIESWNDGKVATDLSLPPMFRVEGNMWKVEYFKAVEELRKANKGLKRLNKKVKSNE